MSDVLNVYTDGGRRPIDGVNYGGWGAFFSYGNDKDFGIYGPSGETNSNNVGELMGYNEALIYANANAVQINTFHLDSTYVLDGSQKHLPKWKKNDWKTSTGSDVKNKALWEAIDKNQTLYLQKYPKPQYRWVKGHSGNPGNEAADKLATKGLYSNIEGYPSTKVFNTQGELPVAPEEGKKPKRVKVEPPNPYFCLGNILDTVHKPYLKDKDGKTIYILETFTTKTKGAEDDDGGSGRVKTKKKKKESKIRNLGILDPDMMEGVVLATDQCPIYDRIKQMQDKLARPDLPYPYIVNWAKVTVSKVWQEIKTSESLPFKAVGQDIFMIADDVHISYFLDVPRRASAAYGTAMVKLDLLERWKSGELKGTEITDMFLTENAKKKVMFKKTTDFDKVIPIETEFQGKPITINMTRKIDIPEIGDLKRMWEQDNAKIYVMRYIETPISFRYAIVVEGDKNIGIYNSPCSSIKMVP